MQLQHKLQKVFGNHWKKLAMLVCSGRLRRRYLDQKAQKRRHKMRIEVKRKNFALKEAFRISRGSKTVAEVLEVQLRDGDFVGRGEAVPYARYGESMAQVEAQIAAVSVQTDRHGLQELLPAGAARNALDCAFWDLEAKRAGRPVWQLAQLDRPRPVISAYTLSLAAPEMMEAVARKHAFRPILKVKLGTPQDMPRLEAVRRGAPDARLIVDANEGWSAEIYTELALHLLRLGVEMVEQPLPADADGALAEIARPVPVCADESCHSRASLAGLRGKYDMVNIKLDKTGGLTEALALRQAALAQGFEVMVGCMVASSLAMAPAVLLAQGVALADLDGPLLLAQDRHVPLNYDKAGVHPPEPALWG